MLRIFSFRKVLFICLGIVLLLTGIWATDYLALSTPKANPSQPTFISTDTTNTESVTSANKVSYQLQVVAEDLFVPWSIVFTSPERILVTERSGSIRVIENEQLLEQPLKIFAEVSSKKEEGLMGMTLDPYYEKNNYLYVCLAYDKGDKLVDKVVRLTDKGNQLTDEQIVIDDIPAARFHAGCRLRFGPDEKLYITTGDATDKNQAQNLDSLAGKILRINSDGSIPTDNPFANSPIYSYGHRNSQGIDWHPESGLLFSTEHGPSVFDGPAGGDEVNIITKGENYGWPLVSHEKSQPSLIDPTLVFTPAIAPASGMFYTGEIFPEFENNFFFGLLKGEGIMRVVLNQTDTRQVIMFETLPNINVGRIREITQGPNGAIYFTTSNRDGRAEERVGDDRVYRIKSK